MANIPAPTPLQNARINAYVPGGAGAIIANQILTDIDVIMETDRLKGIKRARKLGGNNAVTNQEMADAIARQHKIVTKYAEQGAAPAWANAIIVHLDQIDAKIRQIDDRIGQMDARIGQMDDKIKQMEKSGQ